MAIQQGHLKKQESEHLSEEHMTKEGIRKQGGHDRFRIANTSEREIDKKTWNRKGPSFPH